MKKDGFTMIELVFVIVILGILAAVAIPKFAATRTDAQISKGRSEVASIRSAIITERQSRLITGDHNFIATGTGSGQLDNGGLFGGVLTYPIADSTEDGHWHFVSRDSNTSKYQFNIAGTSVNFTYTRSDGKFDCDHTKTYCKKLTE